MAVRAFANEELQPSDDRSWPSPSSSLFDDDYGATASDSGSDANDKGRKRAAAERALAVVGLPRGDASFTVEPLHGDWRDPKKPRVPREDGRPWPPDQEEGEGGHYEAKWRTEEEERRRILERHPDYQFVTLVAGGANTVVEQLFEEADVLGVFRREQALRTQQRLALEEVRASTKQLQEDVRQLTAESGDVRAQRKRVRTSIADADRLLRSLAHTSDALDDEQRFLAALQDKHKIVGAYAGRGLVLDDRMMPVRVELGAAARREIDRPVEPGSEEARVGANLRALLDAMEQDMPNGRSGVANELLAAWMLQDDPDAYEDLRGAEQRRDPDAAIAVRAPFARALLARLPTDITREKEKVDAATLEMLQRFYDALFFLDAENVLAVDARDLFAPPPPRPLPVPGRAPPPPAPRQRLPFVPARVENLYRKYGGTLLPPAAVGGAAAAQETRVYHTSEYALVRDEIARRALADPAMKARLEAVRSGPFLDELKAHREWQQLQLPALEREVEAVRRQLAASRDRLSRVRRGEVRFEDVEQPYRHRRRWVEAPEHSGVVRLKPIVVQAIDEAFGVVQRWTGYGSRVDVEFMQHDAEIRGDFARLVAIKMAFAAMRFPKQYLQLGLRTAAKQDEADVVARLRAHYSVRLDGARDPPAYTARVLTQAEREWDVGGIERARIVLRA
jgi:hypothetical protein